MIFIGYGRAIGRAIWRERGTKRLTKGAINAQSHSKLESDEIAIFYCHLLQKIYITNILVACVFSTFKLKLHIKLPITLLASYEEAWDIVGLVNPDKCCGTHSKCIKFKKIMVCTDYWSNLDRFSF